MIKLLWNTSRHQNDSFELTWGKYHEENSKDWIYFLLQDINYTSINSEEEINKEEDNLNYLNKFYKIKLNSSKRELKNKIRATNTKFFKPYIILHKKKFIYSDN